MFYSQQRKLLSCSKWQPAESPEHRKVASPRPRSCRFDNALAAKQRLAGKKPVLPVQLQLQASNAAVVSSHPPSPLKLLELYPVRIDRVLAEAALLVLLVFGAVAFEPFCVTVARCKSRRKLHNLYLDMPLSRGLCLLEDTRRRTGVEIVFPTIRADFSWHTPNDGHRACTVQGYRGKSRGCFTLLANGTLHGVFLVPCRRGLPISPLHNCHPTPCG